MVVRRSRGMPARYRAKSGVAGAVSKNGAELALVRRLVSEREVLRVRLQEEVERIQHRHLGDQIHLDAQLARRLREHEAREIVRLRILLPVDEVLGRLDLERVGQDARAAMGRRPQPHDLRSEHHRPVVPVMHHMIERYMNRHRVGSRGKSLVYSMRAAGEGNGTGVALTPRRRPGCWLRGAR